MRARLYIAVSTITKAFFKNFFVIGLGNHYGVPERCLSVLFVRDLEPGDLELLNRMLESPKRKVVAKIILYSTNGYTVTEIAEKTTLGKSTIYKQIQTFNREGLNGLRTGRKRRHASREPDSEEFTALKLLLAHPKTNKPAQIVLHSVNGYAVKEIAKEMTISRTTVAKAIHIFNDEGINGLRAERFRSGRKRRHVARPLTKSELQQIERTNSYELERINERIRIVTLSNEGYAVGGIAKKLHRNVKTIRKWITMFNNEGVIGLYKVERRRDYQHSGGRLVSVVEAIRRREGLRPNEHVPMELLQNRF